MSSFGPYLPLLTVAVIAAVTLYVALLRRSLKAFEVILLILILSIPLIMLGIYSLDFYGMGIFVALPLLIGFVSVLLYGRNAPERTWRECRNIALGSTLLVGTAALLCGLEGVVCLAMASPLVLLLGLTGGALAYSLRTRFWRQRASPVLLLLLLLSAPLLMGAEAAVPRQAPLYEVRTAVEIDAPPEVVWRNVVSFRELPPPDDWVFHTGIAYPVRAEIRGRGAGAVRYCEFSTGPFVEPIEVWDEPRRLAFRSPRTHRPSRSSRPTAASTPRTSRGSWSPGAASSC